MPVSLLLVFSMPDVGAFELHAGTGGYYIRSNAQSFDNTADIIAFSQGWMGAMSWDAQAWKTLRSGTRLTWYGATEFGDAALLLQLSFRFDLLRY